MKSGFQTKFMVSWTLHYQGLLLKDHLKQDCRVTLGNVFWLLEEQHCCWHGHSIVGDTEEFGLVEKYHVLQVFIEVKEDSILQHIQSRKTLVVVDCVASPCDGYTHVPIPEF